jgi:hypothetical protein
MVALLDEFAFAVMSVIGILSNLAPVLPSTVPASDDERWEER